MPDLTKKQQGYKLIGGIIFPYFSQYIYIYKDISGKDKGNSFTRVFNETEYRDFTDMILPNKELGGIIASLLQKKPLDIIIQDIYKEK